MNDSQDRINKLLDKLEILLQKQESFSREVNELRDEITQLKTTEPQTTREEITPVEEVEIKAEPVILNHQQTQQKVKETQTYSIPESKKSPKIKSNIEKFIGENLINKIGIAITVIGVAIGAKYSIENDLISPLTRIILGYLVGIALLGIGIKLKPKYESYSAVLVSGAMAIMYFITYSAYSFYDLIPQVFTFVLMAIFTVFTVIAAINYNKQVIAHIGLVGAYAIPFLLSEDSGAIAVLYSYMAIINIGILVITIKKYWKSLFYSSFVLTWLIYFSWYVSEYQTEEFFALALTFLIVFFAIFYSTFIVYKLIKNEKLGIENIALLLLNSFIFFGFGYAILNSHETGRQALGLFALCNAIIHFIVSLVIYKQKLADRNLFFLVIGLVLVFITIAIPIQLDGNWVTLLWVGEATLLFWIGRTKNVPIYEILSYPLMILAFFSIIHDWTTVYNSYYIENLDSRLTPIFNINFLTSFLFITSFGFINFLNLNKTHSSALISKKTLFNIISYSIPIIFLFILYYAFRIEITTYWKQLFIDSEININANGQEYSDYYNNYDLLKFKIIWILNYTLLFLSVLSFVNIKKIKNQLLAFCSLSLNTITIAVFLIQGLYVLSELRESYLEQTLAEYYHIGLFNIGIRYISFAFVTLLLVVSYKTVRQEFMKVNFRMAFDFLLYTSILWIISSELVSWMDIADSSESFKLSLSILWGVYSLSLIGLGIWKKKKHLRIGSFALFGVTLLKLFFYDISHLDTIAKTVVFVSLGILLLIISFLYNKYKHIIFDETEN